MKNCFLYSDPVERFTFTNVNALSIPRYRGARITDVLANRKYNDRLDFVPDGDGYVARFEDGTLCHPFSEDSDNGLCSRDYIAISSVHAEPRAVKVDGMDFSL